MGYPLRVQNSDCLATELHLSGGAPVDKFTAVIGMFTLVIVVISACD